MKFLKHSLSSKNVVTLLGNMVASISLFFKLSNSILSSLSLHLRFKRSKKAIIICTTIHQTIQQLLWYIAQPAGSSPQLVQRVFVILSVSNTLLQQLQLCALMSFTVLKEMSNKCCITISASFTVLEEISNKCCITILIVVLLQSLSDWRLSAGFKGLRIYANNWKRQ